MKQGLKVGLVKSWRTYLWIMKILIPISLGVTALQWSGLLPKMGVFLGPVMGLFRLPAEAAVPIILGVVVGPAGCVGAMMALPFSQAQMTLIGIFCLIAHSLPTESAVQAKAGFGWAKSLTARLGGASLLVIIVAPMLGAVPEMPPVEAAAAVQGMSLAQAGLLWLRDLIKLAATMIVLVTVFLGAMEVCRAMGWIDPLARALSPAVRLMGLPPRVGLLWAAANIFGLTYGSAIIVEESTSGNLTDDEVQSLHWSISINHSLFEDPAVFLALGLPFFWLYVPRLLMAMAVGRLFTLWLAVRSRTASPPA